MSDDFKNFTMAESYGNPKCHVCQGRGRLPVPGVTGGPPAVRLCRCVLLQEILNNVERGMHGLSQAAKVPSSPLTKQAESNTWVTAHLPWFSAHLRHVALRRSPRWGFQVVTDADLMQAWLATKALDGAQIIDADVFEAATQRSFNYMSLVDIALPAHLLVIRLGVKSARNAAMPEVLLEALRMRAHENRPTWVWDQPDCPLDAGDHRCWSPLVMGEVASWARIREGDEEKLPVSKGGRRKANAADTPSAQGSSVRDMLLGGAGSKENSK